MKKKTIIMGQVVEFDRPESQVPPAPVQEKQPLRLANKPMGEQSQVVEQPQEAGINAHQEEMYRRLKPSERKNHGSKTGLATLVITATVLIAGGVYLAKNYEEILPAELVQYINEVKER